MPIPTSDTQDRLNGPACLAAAEGESALASHHNANGVHNDHHARVIPFPDEEEERTWWQAVLAEWRVIGTILAPFGLAIVLYFIPATRGELERAKNEVTSRIEVDKAGMEGEIQAATAKIDALQVAIGDTKIDMREMRRDMKELLRRSDRILPPEPPIEQAQPKIAPAKPATSKKRTPKPPQPQQSGLSLFR